MRKEMVELMDTLSDWATIAICDQKKGGRGMTYTEYQELIDCLEVEVMEVIACVINDEHLSDNEKAKLLIQGEKVYYLA